MPLQCSAHIFDPTQTRSRRGKGAIDSELVTTGAGHCASQPSGRQARLLPPHAPRSSALHQSALFLTGQVSTRKELSMRKFPAGFNIGLANCRKKVEDAKPCRLRNADFGLRIEKQESSFLNPHLSLSKERKSKLRMRLTEGRQLSA